jgi:hypothetical protein
MMMNRTPLNVLPALDFSHLLDATAASEQIKGG